MKSIGLILSFCAFLFLIISCNSNTNSTSQNNLANETSAYLKLHAKNPVYWQPWGPEALEAAKTQDKLVIISIGYVSCHWCHVMEEESFSDDSTAAKMNKHFVSVKVDREEQPGVDKAYMNASYLINGTGGWPLNIIALPDGRPLYAGTYLTIKQWNKLLDFFIETKRDDFEKLEKQATALMEGLNALEDITPEAERVLEASLLSNSATVLLQYADKKLGGRSGAPKFPNPPLLQFQLHLADTYDNDTLKTQTLLTLDQILKGGIYDHLAGGFFRYSTDAFWRVPHFEKMLYDNGQLISMLANAYKLTKDEKYKIAIEETLQFIEANMSDGAAFYSSIDADSEGEEGKFYIWEEKEIDLANLGNPILFKKHFGIDEQLELDGKQVLYIEQTAAALSGNGHTPDQIKAALDADKLRLRKIRDSRIKPFLDQKIITSWNAMMTTGYLHAYEALGDSTYLLRALKALDYLTENVVENDVVMHLPGEDLSYLPDAVFLSEALIKAYENTFEITYLEQASAITKQALKEFGDPSSPYYYYSNPKNGDLVVNVREVNDNVIPGANSQLALNLYQLGHYYYDSTFINQAESMLKGRLTDLPIDPYSNANWGRLAVMMEKGIYEVAFTGPEAIALRKEMATNYLPNCISLGTVKEENLILLENKVRQSESVIYVCQNKSCRLPVNDVDRALGLME